MAPWTQLRWPFVLGLAGAVLTLCATVALFRSLPGDGVSLLVPGETTFTISKPGKYTLWSEVEASFDGQLMTFATGLPAGVTIKITTTDGSIVPVASRWPTTREDTGRIIRIAIGTVTFSSAGSYRLSTEGLQEKRALYLNQFEFYRSFIAAGLACFGFSLLVSGVIWGVGIYVWRRKKA